MAFANDTPKAPISANLMWLAVVAAFVICEMFLISALYQHGFVFTCRDAAPDWFCAFAGRIVPRVLAVLAALMVFALARPAAVRTVVTSAAEWRLRAVLINLFGFILVLAPWWFLSDQSSSAAVATGIASWSIGGVLAGSGLALMIAPVRAWQDLLRQHGGLLLALILLALALPEITDEMQPLWRSAWVTELTFGAVVQVMLALGYEVQAVIATRVIGADGFFVAVGPQCSGVEGFALISVFTLVYIWLFRSDLRLPRALLLLPIGILISWVFNVVRISALLSLGAEVSPELAIGGFHSHAGWLSFIILAVCLILGSRSIPFFMKDALVQAVQNRAPLPPFFEDRIVAEILPFAVFMLSALLASTFSQTPGIVYPIRAALMIGVLALFWKVYRALPWRLDPLAVAAGAVIGALWVVTSPDTTGAPAYGALTGAAFVGWVIARMIGTSLLVPMIEELMFRGYLLRRIAPEGNGLRMALAVGVSAALFALLHDRWLAAALAGVVFGLLVWRSRNLTDAIVAHATANALIAIWAVVFGAWHVI